MATKKTTTKEIPAKKVVKKAAVKKAAPKKVKAPKKVVTSKLSKAVPVISSDSDWFGETVTYKIASTEDMLFPNKTIDPVHEFTEHDMLTEAAGDYERYVPTLAAPRKPGFFARLFRRNR